MTVLVSWSVTQMIVQRNENGFADVVTHVAYLCSATDGTNEARKGEMIRIGPLIEGDFLPYAGLTQEEALTWVFGILGTEGKAAIEADVAGQVVYVADPPAASLPLPW